MGLRICYRFKRTSIWRAMATGVHALLGFLALSLLCMRGLLVV